MARVEPVARRRGRWSARRQRWRGGAAPLQSSSTRRAGTTGARSPSLNPAPMLRFLAIVYPRTNQPLLRFSPTWRFLFHCYSLHRRLPAHTHLTHPTHPPTHPSRWVVEVSKAFLRAGKDVALIHDFDYRHGGCVNFGDIMQATPPDLKELRDAATGKPLSLYKHAVAVTFDRQSTKRALMVDALLRRHCKAVRAEDAGAALCAPPAVPRNYLAAPLAQPLGEITAAVLSAAAAAGGETQHPRRKRVLALGGKGDWGPGAHSAPIPTLPHPPLTSLFLLPCCHALHYYGPRDKGQLLPVPSVSLHHLTHLLTTLPPTLPTLSPQAPERPRSRPSSARTTPSARPSTTRSCA